MANGWKITAIMFIALFLLETAFVIWIFKESQNILNNEAECAYNICDDYESFYFDSYENLCYCYDDGEIKKQVLIK